MVSLAYAEIDLARAHFCGGALISPGFVLTAAHCVENLVSTPEAIVVVLGRTNLTERGGSLQKVYFVGGVRDLLSVSEITSTSKSRVISYNQNALAETILASGFSIGSGGILFSKFSSAIIVYGLQTSDLKPSMLQMDLR